MSIKEIMSSLDGLREHLQMLDHDYDFTFEDMKRREETNSRLTTKLEELHQVQDKLLTFNVGGKEVKIFRYIVTNTGYNTYLSNLVLQHEQEGRLSQLNETKIDKSFENFLVVLDVLRRKYHEKVLNIEEKQLKFILPYEIKTDSLKEDFEFYFKEDQDKLFDDFKFFYFDQSNNKKVMYGKTANLTNLICNITCSGWYPNELHKPYKATGIDDIKSKSSLKAYFLTNQATLTIEFIEPVPVKFLEIEAFTYDQDVWFPGDGAGDQIHWSLDGSKWNKLGVIPIDYGTETSVVFFEEVNLKYIKFTAGEYGSSLAYLKVS